MDYSGGAKISKSEKKGLYPCRNFKDRWARISFKHGRKSFFLAETCVGYSTSRLSIFSIEQIFDDS